MDKIEANDFKRKGVTFLMMNEERTKKKKKKKNKKKTIVANDNGRKVFNVLSDRDIKSNRNRKQSSYQRHVFVVTPVE